MTDLVVTQLKRDGLGPLDLRVDGGRTLALHGPSGSGKTLLLRAIADLDPNQGEVRLGDTERASLPAHQWRARLVYVPPESHWWADTVGPHAAHWNQQQLAALGFGMDVLDWEIRRLSSGERQRLSLVRSLSAGPAGLLLDEPTANLDHDNTLRVEELVADYRQQHQAPVVWVSHDPAQRERIADPALEMNGGQLR